MSPGKWIAGLLCCVSLAAAAQRKDLVSYANTLQGTNSEFALSHGNTHPSTALPFGMHAWSAQTGKNGDGWKYQYKATSIRGFQQVHQCSPWTGDYAVFKETMAVNVLRCARSRGGRSCTKFIHVRERNSQQQPRKDR